MKVLWFTTSPSLAEKQEGRSNITGGWIKSEEQALKVHYPDIILGVVFPSDRNTEPYEIDDTFYFPVKNRKLSRIMRLLSRTNIRKSDYELHNKRYLEIIQYFNPDLIHIHGSENDFGSILTSVSLPVILSIQGLITVIEHKYFIGVSRWQTSLKYLSPSNKFLIQFNDYKYLRSLESKTLNAIKYVFGRTHWDKRITSVLAPQARYFHIDRVLRSQFYENEWHPLTNDGVVLITTLRSSIYKGFETILETAGILQEQRINFKWKIVGLSSSDLLVKILRKKLKNVAEKIIFLGKLKEEQVIDELLTSDIFIQSSRIENSPNGVAEALYLGMPVIASFAGGTSSLVTDQKDGILVQDGDPWVLAGAVKELANNREMAATLGKHARNNAIKKHNPKVIADKIAAAYLEVINDKRKHD